MYNQIKEVHAEELREKQKEIEELRLEIEHKKAVAEKDREIDDLLKQEQGLPTFKEQERKVLDCLDYLEKERLEVQQTKNEVENELNRRRILNGQLQEELEGKRAANLSFLVTNLLLAATLGYTIYGMINYGWFKEVRVVEKVIEITHEIPVEKTIYKTIEKEVPVEKVVYRDRVVNKEVPVEKVVYRDKVVEKEKLVPIEKIIYKDELSVNKGGGKCFQKGMTTSQLIQVAGEPLSTEIIPSNKNFLLDGAVSYFLSSDHIKFNYAHFSVLVNSKDRKVVDWTTNTPEKHKCNY